MTAMNAFEPVAQRLAMATPTGAPTFGQTHDIVAREVAPAMFTLRKSGSRPLGFSGRHLGHLNGYRLGTALWHELNLYQADDGRFVAEIRVYTKAEGARDQFHVHVADTLEEAVSFFEDYDPKGDVTAEFDIADSSLSPVELLLQAAALKYRVADAVNQYRAVLGAFLQELNNA